MEKIISLIHEAQNFILTGHTSPDGDSIGSCFGLAFALAHLGKDVTVVLEPYPQKYHIIPGRQFLHQGSVDKLIGGKPYVLIALDTAEMSRLGVSQCLFPHATHTVCIDHHKTNTGFAELNHIQPDASSTSEMVYYLIEKLAPLTQDIAAAIYAGIVCDTGGFKYHATSPSTFEVAEKLIATGIPFTHIYNEVYHMHSFGATKAKGIVLNNAKQALDGRITYAHISRAELEQAGASTPDLDGFVEYLLTTRGSLVALLVYETKSKAHVKASFRSHGIDVAKVANAMGGGGHQLASATTVKGTLAAVMAQALDLLKEEILSVDRRSEHL